LTGRTADRRSESRFSKMLSRMGLIPLTMPTCKSHHDLAACRLKQPTRPATKRTESLNGQPPARAARLLRMRLGRMAGRISPCPHLTTAEVGCSLHRPHRRVLTTDREYRRPASSHMAHVSRRSPSPSRRSYEDRHLPPSRHGEPPQPFFRPNTASSSSSYPSVASYPGGLSRQYSLGSTGADRRDALWDKAAGSHKPPTTASPAPYSPPPTADGDDAPLRASDGKHNYDGADGYSDGRKRPRRSHTYDTDDSFRPQSRGEQPERAKPTHLPPSLAALAITRPIEYDEPRAPSRALPSLGLVLEPEALLTPRMKGAEWDLRDKEDGVTGTRSQSGTPTLLDGPVQRKIAGRSSPLEAVPMRSDSKSSSASSLPRFNDLFR